MKTIVLNGSPRKNWNTALMKKTEIFAKNVMILYGEAYIIEAENRKTQKRGSYYARTYHARAA